MAKIDSCITNSKEVLKEETKTTDKNNKDDAVSTVMLLKDNAINN